MKFNIEIPNEDIKELKKAIADYNKKSGEKHSFDSFVRLLITKELPGHEIEEVRYNLNNRKVITAKGDIIERCISY